MPSARASGRSWSAWHGSTYGKSPFLLLDRAESSVHLLLLLHASIAVAKNVFVQPAPPQWLNLELQRLQDTCYPDDLFEATMRYRADSTSSKSIRNLYPDVPVSSDTKFTYQPRIKCLDCPRKVYTPGPDFTLGHFEVHLKNRHHREKVECRRKLVLPDIREPGPLPSREQRSRL